MDTRPVKQAELVDHLRHAHGYGDLEPGGRHHVPGSLGLPYRLEIATREDLTSRHDSDHAEGWDERHTHDVESGNVSVAMLAFAMLALVPVGLLSVFVASLVGAVAGTF